MNKNTLSALVFFSLIVLVDASHAEAYRESAKSGEQLQRDFFAAVKAGDYKGAESIGGMHSSAEMMRVMTNVITLRQEGWAQPEIAFAEIAAATGDYRVLRQIAEIHFDSELLTEPARSQRSRQELDAKGMAYFQKAAELYLQEHPFRQEIELSPPLRGLFHNAQGPMGGRTYHSGFNSFYSYDLFYPKSATHPNSMGQPIYAIADGVVTHAVDEFPDNPLDVKLDRVSKANYIVVEHASGIKSHYAHIQQRSAKVKVGDRVVRGQPICAVGNSGYTTGPHLHFTVERVGDPFALPVGFTGLFQVSKDDGTIVATTDLSLAPAAYLDQFEQKSRPASVYAHTEGDFVNTASDNWEERDGAGRLKFAFRELGREQSHIVLYDSQRNVYVRIPRSGGMAQYAMGASADWRDIAVVFPR